MNFRGFFFQNLQLDPPPTISHKIVLVSMRKIRMKPSSCLSLFKQCHKNYQGHIAFRILFK